jgi:hypothetical protein
VLSVKELHRIASKLSPEEFERQLGPYALVQRPVDEGTQQKSLELGVNRTVMAAAHQPDDLSMLFQLDDLMVATLPPVPEGDSLKVGRLPDCDLVVDDPSVSKQHAALMWDQSQRRVMVQDLASSNGTTLNGVKVTAAVAIKDGDTIAFGDARFCMLLSRTLYSKLTTGKFRGG